MIINGRVSYIENGFATSIRAMQVQSELVSMTNQNIIGFDKIGYQRQEPVISSFTEFLGVKGLSQTTDDKIGRIMMSENPLDLAISTKGYFQTRSAEGVKLTRDGRFKIDKDGNLLTQEDHQVLSNAGVPIKLHVVPDDLKKIKVDDNGLLSVFNDKTKKQEAVAYIGVVDANGIVVMDPKIKQGYNEYSNVALQNEFMSLMPIIRTYEANRQIFMIQNQNLQKVISQLGSAS